MISEPPEWFSSAERKLNPYPVNTLVTRERGLRVIEDIIKHSNKTPSKIIVAFDIDRTLRIGTSSGTIYRDSATKEILDSLSSLGVILLLITGAHADSNPNYVDATRGAIDRIKPVKLENYFMEEANLSPNIKETIIKGQDYQIRYKGRVIVSQEKDYALDYYLSCVYGALDPQGRPTEKMPELFIFVDDSDLNILAVHNRFKNSSLLALPVICLFYEPTLEMFSHNPMDGDNPKPGCLELVYQYQLEHQAVLKLEENRILIQKIYSAYSLPLPAKYQ